MFGIGKRNRNVFRRTAGIGGAVAGRGLGPVAALGLGMMALRWWRSRRAARQTGPAAQTWNPGGDVAGRPVTQW
jgi:hypothetical protein